MGKGTHCPPLAAIVAYFALALALWVFGAG
jgi:hypothetical protein